MEIEGEEMVKKLVTITHFYGRQDGEEVVERYVVEDSKNERERIVKHWFPKNNIFFHDYVGDFLNGSINDIFAEWGYGGWDEPTAREISIRTKEEITSVTKANYEREIEEINRFFGGGE